MLLLAWCRMVPWPSWSHWIHFWLAKLIFQPECIPVGCVLAARRLYTGVWSRGVGVCSAEGGVCPWGCLIWGVSALGGSAPGWVGVVCSQGGGHPSMHWGRPPTLWTEWMTDRCKNITLATISLRPVTSQLDRMDYFWFGYIRLINSGGSLGESFTKVKTNGNKLVDVGTSSLLPKVSFPGF